MDKSVVEYFSAHDGYRCGYCHSTDTCYSHGMWAHMLTPLDYQNLIDRGWRRSGKYCYKPTMNLTCCPLYAIRCEAKMFTLSRSQKKVLKRVHRYLAFGDQGKTSHAASSENVSDQEMDASDYPQEVDMQSVKKIKKVQSINQSDIKTEDPSTLSDVQDRTDSPIKKCATSQNETRVASEPSQPNTTSDNCPAQHSSNSRDNRPQCRKAKVIRQEKKLQKLLKMGKSPEEAMAAVKKKAAEPKSLEDFLNQPFPSEPAHKLEFRLVPSRIENRHFNKTFEESYTVYKKYQMAIHNDPPEKCSSKQYTRFLVNNPFQSHEDATRKTYGAFHYQYWLDDKLIAVGVVDILPYCISSVYFYYDPDYSFLSLGTYAALREIALTRELNAKIENLQYYYMGFYIHSCVKMRYKGQYVPSYLLCPETYLFQPIEKARPKLDVSKYHRLEEDPLMRDCNADDNIGNVVILHNKRQMKYSLYRQIKKEANDEDEVKEYAKFVGKKCYSRMLLYRE